MFEHTKYFLCWNKVAQINPLCEPKNPCWLIAIRLIYQEEILFERMKSLVEFKETLWNKAFCCWNHVFFLSALSRNSTIQNAILTYFNVSPRTNLRMVRHYGQRESLGTTRTRRFPGLSRELTPALQAICWREF